MKKLHLSRIVIQWVKHFMTKRSINLIFDEHKSKTYYIESGIPQGSPISPILFLIYMCYLFPKIRMKFNAHSPSFIDDVGIYVENKTVMIYLETSHRDTRNEYNKDEEGKRQSTTRTCPYISSTALVPMWYSRHGTF